MTLGISAHRPKVPFTGEATHNEKPIEMLGGDLSIFEEPHQATETPGLRAAKMPTLFDLESDRAAWARPESYANVARGLRQKPTVRCAVLLENQPNRSFHAGPNWLATTHFSSSEVTIIDAGAGATRSINIEGVSRVYRFAPTHEGVIISGRDEAGGEALALIDTHDSTLRWSTAGSTNPFEVIHWIHSMPWGNIVVLHAKTEGTSATTYLSWVNAQTGKVEHEMPCSFLSSTYSFIESFFRSFQPFAYDSDRQEVTFVRPSRDRKMAVFAAVNLETGECATRGEIHDLRERSLNFVRNGQAVLVDPEPPGRAFKFDSKAGQWKERSFETGTHYFYYGSPRFSRTHGINADLDAFSFFTNTNDGFETFCTIPINHMNFHQMNLCDVVITSDNVAYISRLVDEEANETRFRLSAYDATTGTLLWEHDETFPSMANIIVNQDGSVSWGGDDHVVILEN